MLEQLLRDIESFLKASKDTLNIISNDITTPYIEGRIDAYEAVIHEINRYIAIEQKTKGGEPRC